MTAAVGCCHIGTPLSCWVVTVVTVVTGFNNKYILYKYIHFFFNCSNSVTIVTTLDNIGIVNVSIENSLSQISFNNMKKKEIFGKRVECKVDRQTFIRKARVFLRFLANNDGVVKNFDVYVVEPDQGGIRWVYLFSIRTIIN